MAENTVKENIEEKEKKKGKGIFNKIDRAIDLERLFDEGIPYKLFAKSFVYSVDDIGLYS